MRMTNAVPMHYIFDITKNKQLSQNEPGIKPTNIHPRWLLNNNSPMDKYAELAKVGVRNWWCF